MWVARDKDGLIAIYNQKPKKEADLSQWLLPEATGEFINIDEEDWFFPEVKWEDDEPTEIILKK